MNKKTLLSLSLLTLFSANTFAAVSLNEITANIQKNLPNRKVLQVQKLPDVNLYEFTYEKGTTPYYTDENVTFFIAGTNVEIISTKTKKNVTLDKELNSVKSIFNNLPLKESFSVKYGKGTRKIAVFTDPDCPFCKELDHELLGGGLDNYDVTIYYFMNPLTTLHPNAMQKSKQVLCSSNPAESWKSYMNSGILPDNNGQCSNNAEKNKALARKLGYNSTPVILFDNGYLANFKVTAAQVKQVLEAAKP